MLRPGGDRGVLRWRRGLGWADVQDIRRRRELAQEGAAVIRRTVRCPAALPGCVRHAGALLAAKFAARLGEARVFSYGLVVCGLTVVIYSRLGPLPAAIGLFALAGIPLAAVNVVVNPMMLRITPKHLIGRVATVMNPLVNVASIASMALAGFLASTVLRRVHVVVAGVTFSWIDVIFGVGGLLMVAAGLASVKPLQESTAVQSEAAVEEQEGAATP